MTDELEDIKGLGATSIEKLAKEGIVDLIGLAVRSPGSLAETIGVGVATARKFIQTAREMLKFKPETGLDIDKRRSELVKIKTGCKPIDDMFGGGVETASITEIYGQWASGKSNVAHFLMCVAYKQMPDRIMYLIDAEKSFRPERIRDFCKGLKLDPEEVLSKIKYYKPFTFEHQMLITEEIDKEIATGKEKVSLVVVDSISGLMRNDFQGRGTLAERQQLLNKHIHLLSKIADIYNCCVFITNQVMANPGISYGIPISPVGGEILGHNSDTRVFIRKGKADSRVMKLVDSPHLPISEAEFNITSTGFEELK